MANILKSLESLFISKVRIKALRYFVFNPDKPIHLRAAVRELKEEINAVRRELNRLDEIGLITSETKGNRKYFTLNPQHPILPELMAIFHKSFGLGGNIVQNEKKLGSIKYAILTANYFNPQSSNAQAVDLVIVGQVDLPSINAMIEDAEKKLGREIHYTVMRDHEFILRKKRKDSFIIELLVGYKILLIGNELDLSRGE